MSRELRFGMPPAVGYGNLVTVTLMNDGDEVRLTWPPDNIHYLRRHKDEEYKAFVARVIAYGDQRTRY